MPASLKLTICIMSYSLAVLALLKINLLAEVSLAIWSDVRDMPMCSCVDDSICLIFWNACLTCKSEIDKLL